jgi:hypothetical protein
MKKIFLTTVISILTIYSLFAQNEMDALRYSMIQNGGTARFTSMGGAFGALGGDFSVLSLNPAGLGIYRSSEITITPSIGYQSIESSLFGNTDEDLKYNFNLNNIGVVFAIPVGNKTDAGGWKFVNLGVGLNRHNNFNSRWAVEGFNTNNSLMTSFLEQARREGSVNNFDDFTTGLAWETYLLDEDEGSFFVDMNEGNVLQRQTMNTSGYIREFVLSVGANYDDFLYFGATVGLPSVSYEQSSIFMESDSENSNQFFNSLTYRSNYKTTGTGFNLKVGGMARLGSVVRLGAALHTPSFYSLKDTYRTNMRSDLDLDPETYPDYTEAAKYFESPEGLFEYEINTPLKMIGSLGLVLGTTGLISFDYEYIDYTKARLRSDDFMFSHENDMIRNTLTAQHNIRAGGEIRLDPLVLRAGYAYHSSPFATGDDGKRNVLSAGFGIRGNSYTLDFAYAYSIYSEDYALYVLENVARSPVVQRDYSASIFRLTLGWRF